MFYLSDENLKADTNILINQIRNLLYSKYK